MKEVIIVGLAHYGFQSTGSVCEVLVDKLDELERECMSFEFTNCYEDLEHLIDRLNYNKIESNFKPCRINNNNKFFQNKPKYYKNKSIK